MCVYIPNSKVIRILENLHMESCAREPIDGARAFPHGQRKPSRASYKDHLGLSLYLHLLLRFSLSVLSTGQVPIHFSSICWW